LEKIFLQSVRRREMDLRETIAGGAAGVAQNLVGFPLDSVKVRMVTSPVRVSMGQTMLTGEALCSVLPR
jgi:hypothetical protein